MRRPARGFTLLEVIVAVAILAIALGAVISGMARFADQAGYLRQKTIALWVAHNRMTEMVTQKEPPQIGKEEGKAEMSGIEWKWKSQILATEDPLLLRIDVTVQAPGVREGDIAQLSGFIAKPQ